MRLYYSKPQLTLLRVMRITRCLCLRQIRTLLRLAYSITEPAASSIIRQLIHSGDVYLDRSTDCLLLPDRQHDPLIIAAVDIALALATTDDIPHFLPAEPPYLLLACYVRRAIQLGVIAIPETEETLKCIEMDQLVQQAQKQERNLLPVLLLTDESQIPQICTQFPCFLAFPDQSGRLTILKNKTSEAIQNEPEHEKLDGAST